MKRIVTKRNLLTILVCFTFILISFLGVAFMKPRNASAATNNAATTYSVSAPFLELELIGEGKDYYLIRVTNTTSEGVYVEYNEFMCYGDDAKNWSALGHLKTVYLGTSENTASSSSKTKDVMVYNFPITSTHITFSYINGDTRYITYADHIDGGNLSLTTYTNTVTVYHECLEITSASFSSGKWHVTVHNPNSYSVSLEYNTKMCFEDDAKNWTGLNDPGEVETISAYGSTSVDVSENWFATCIAFSFQRNGKRYITYAYDLNKIIPSIMTVITVIK